MRRFLREPRLLAEAGTAPAGPAVELPLPGGTVEVRGAGRASLERLEAVRKALGGRRPTGPRAAGLRVHPSPPDAFRDAASIRWDTYLELEAGPEGVTAAGYRWLLRLTRSLPLEADLWLDAEADGAVLDDLWENVLRLVAAYTVFAAGGLVVHSAAAAIEGRGVLFPAPSGGGKSTAAALLERDGAPVLSDDCNAVIPSPAGGPPALHCLPFGGERRPRRCPLPAVPLAAVLVLERGDATAVRSLHPATAAARLVTAAPFVNADPYLGDRVLDRAAGLLAGVRTGALRPAIGRPAAPAVTAWLASPPPSG